VDPDEFGSAGVEWQFQEYLAGVGGLEHFERGVFGSITGGEWSVEPAQPGSDIMLTLDHRIQYVVEQALIEHCQEMNARVANAVVADPRTGEILAMATVRRRAVGDCYVPRYNASIVDTFEPGSVLKVVTFAAAISELGYTGETLVAVPPSITVGNKSFPDHPRHPAADYPIWQIAAKSMNVGTIKLSQEVGAERLYEYLMAFGFGQESGLGFKDEALGKVPSTWYGSDAGSIPIGQGITVNTVQVLSAYNTLANGGVYVAPKLVRAVIAPDGTRQLPEPREARPIITAAAAAEVTKLLTGVVNSGTGTAAAVPGYTVAGKTGTAWKVHGDGPYQGTYGVDGDREYVVTFAGFLPAENPQLSIVVVVDEPTVETTAGTVAAPVFADIAHYVLRILGIPPAAVETETTGPVRGAPAGLAGEPDPNLANPTSATSDSLMDEEPPVLEPTGDDAQITDGSEADE
ncbi:MAG: penicillin-binding protein 2, partial [Actinomycetota bacterium]|nr:penicillin-binding protein 2 [Actinomycetota bacterium]